LTRGRWLRAALTLGLVALLVLACGSAPAVPAAAPGGTAAPAAQPSFPIRAAFYYPWFPEGWTQEGIFPYSRFRPSAGFYDSADPAVLRAHVGALVYGGFDAAVVSWWGRDEKQEQVRVPALLAAANAVDPAFRVAIYYEREGTGDPTVPQIRADLEYLAAHYAGAPGFLRVAGRPVVFVYNADDTDCSVVDRWTAANDTPGFYLVMKVFPGFEQCARQPDAWHQYSPASPYAAITPSRADVAGSVTISPGFAHAGPSADRPPLARDVRRWQESVRDMVASRAPWQLVTTFNEWGEGTAVESATAWRSSSGQGVYLDALHAATR
jgi:glycosyl hydrolase family 99